MEPEMKIQWNKQKKIWISFPFTFIVHTKLFLLICFFPFLISCSFIADSRRTTQTHIDINISSISKEDANFYHHHMLALLTYTPPTRIRANAIIAIRMTTKMIRKQSFLHWLRHREKEHSKLFRGKWRKRKKQVSEIRNERKETKEKKSQQSRQLMKMN